MNLTELAAELDMNREEVVEGLIAGSSYNTVSIESGGGGEEDAPSIGDSLGDLDAGLAAPAPQHHRPAALQELALDPVAPGPGLEDRQVVEFGFDGEAGVALDEGVGLLEQRVGVFVFEGDFEFGFRGFGHSPLRWARSWARRAQPWPW